MKTNRQRNRRAMSEQAEITPEMIAEYQRRKDEAEQVSMQRCIAALEALAAEHGYSIFAMPAMEVDATMYGRIGARWGVKRR